MGTELPTAETLLYETDALTQKSNHTPHKAGIKQAHGHTEKPVHYFHFISHRQYNKKRDENDKELEVNSGSQVPSP